MTPLGGFPTKKSRSLVSPRTLKATTVQLGQVIKKTDKDSTRLQLLLNVENKLMGLDIAQLQKLWSTVDANGNSLVSQGELTNFVTRHFPELDWKVRIPPPPLPPPIALTRLSRRFPAASRSSLPTSPRTVSYPKKNSACCSSLCCGPTSRCSPPLPSSARGPDGLSQGV